MPRGVKPSRLAEELNVSPRTVRYWISRRRFRVIRYGPRTVRIPYEVFKDILEHGLPAER